jgi:hypothetical protein
MFEILLCAVRGETRLSLWCQNEFAAQQLDKTIHTPRLTAQDFPTRRDKDPPTCAAIA